MQVRRIVNVLAVGFVVVGATTACATKKFVRTEVETLGTKVEQRVETLSQSLETTQEATRQNSASITKVDAKADQVGIWAKEAQTSASAANSAAAAAAARAEAVDAATKRLVYEVVISEDQGNFKFGSAALPEPVQSRIDQMIADLKANPRGNFVEIEGHTDSSGDKTDQPAHRRSARRGGEALSLRSASGAAAQDQRHQLRRRQAREPEQRRVTAARRTAASSSASSRSPRVTPHSEGRAQRARAFLPSRHFAIASGKPHVPCTNALTNLMNLSTSELYEPANPTNLSSVVF